jgi:hypothetical protein
LPFVPIILGKELRVPIPWVPPATPKPSIPAIPTTAIRPGIGRSIVEEEQEEEASWEKCFGG